MTEEEANERENKKDRSFAKALMTLAGAVGTGALVAGAGLAGYGVGKYGGRALGLIGDTNYETGEGKLGFLEKQVTKFTEWMSGYKADGVDEFTKKVRERYTEQEKLWKEQAEAEEKRKQQLEKWRLHALQMQDFQVFQSKLQSDYNRSFMSPEDLRRQLGTDLINTTMQRDTALNNDDFDKAKELEKERFRLLTEMRRLDDTIEKSKKESLEEELRAKENELQIRKNRLAELASLGDERFRFQLGMAEPSKRDSMVADRFESEYKKFIEGTADDPKASFSRIQGLASQLTQTMQNENKSPMKTVQNTTAAAIDSKSIQAAELRNRTWNTEVKRMDQNLQKIAGLNEKMLAAFDKMERHLSNEPGTVSLSAN